MRMLGIMNNTLKRLTFEIKIIMNRENRNFIYLIPIMKRWFVFLLILTFPLLNACNKTDDFEGLELLTEKAWHLTSRTQGGLDIANDCDLDDLLTFEDVTNFDYNYGVLSCPDNDIAKEGDTWKIIDDFTVLRMKYTFSGNGNGTLIEYWKITELSDTLLIVEDALAEDNDQIPEIRTYNN